MDKIASENKRRQEIAELAELIDTRADMLLFKLKKFLGHEKRIRQLKQPVVILLREWGDIEIHENIKAKEWEIPQTSRHNEDAPKKVVFLNKQSLYTMAYGNDTIKVWVVNENDAMPVGANPKVWSESIYHKLQVILVNIHKLQERLGLAKQREISKTVMYIGGAIALVIVAYAVYKMIIPPESAGTAVQTIIQQPGPGLADVNLTG